MTFDVNIIFDAFDTLYPDPTVIPFWNDQTMATTAAQAMIEMRSTVVGGRDLTSEFGEDFDGAGARGFVYV